MQELLAKLKSKEAKIGIVGLGYVGLPLALRYCEAGYDVVGIDIDAAKVDLLNQGKTYIKHIDQGEIANAVKNGLKATADFSSAADLDALILCVPTPLTKQRQPDISFVVNTLESLVPYLHSNQVISLESTTYPGTTDEELKPRIEQNGLKVGQDIFLVYSPEREDPGNVDFTLAMIPKVCSGYTADCLEMGLALYQPIVKKVVPVSSTRAAEMTKLLENIHRAVNIGLVNEMKIVADRMGIDIHEVIRAAATKPFGFVPYYPGPGLGGHCIPIDPFYLTWKAQEFGVHTRFIELAGEVNSNMPRWVANKTSMALNQRKKALNGAKILLLGLSYKKDVDDMRESPSVEIMEILVRCGAEVIYSDPYFSEFPKMRQHHFDMKSVVLTPDLIAGQDCVLIATNHSAFDYEMVKKHAKLIVDTRGVYLEPADHIVKA